MNTKYYYVADCSEQTIKSYTLDEFYDDVVFDFIGRNFDYFEKFLVSFLEGNPESLTAKNAIEVLEGESEPDPITKLYLINIAFILNLKSGSSILFSKNYDQCQHWNKNIKVKAYLCD